MALASSNSFLTASFFVRWYSAMRALIRRTWRVSASSMTSRAPGARA